MKKHQFQHIIIAAGLTLLPLSLQADATFDSYGNFIWGPTTIDGDNSPFSFTNGAFLNFTANGGITQSYLNGETLALGRYDYSNNNQSGASLGLGGLSLFAYSWPIMNGYGYEPNSQTGTNWLNLTMAGIQASSTTYNNYSDTYIASDFAFNGGGFSQSSRDSNVRLSSSLSAFGFLMGQQDYGSSGSTTYHNFSIFPMTDVNNHGLGFYSENFNAEPQNGWTNVFQSYPSYTFFTLGRQAPYLGAKVPLLTIGGETNSLTLMNPGDENTASTQSIVLNPSLGSVTAKTLDLGSGNSISTNPASGKLEFTNSSGQSGIGQMIIGNPPVGNAAGTGQITVNGEAIVSGGLTAKTLNLDGVALSAVGGKLSYTPNNSTISQSFLTGREGITDAYVSQRSLNSICFADSTITYDGEPSGVSTILNLNFAAGRSKIISHRVANSSLNGVSYSTALNAGVLESFSGKIFGSLVANSASVTTAQYGTHNGSTALGNSKVVGSSNYATGLGGAILSGDYVLADGQGTDALSTASTVLGRYNEKPTAASDISARTDATTGELFILGNGTDDTHRFNAVSVNKQGKTTLKRSGYTPPTAPVFAPDPAEHVALQVEGVTYVNGTIYVSKPAGDIPMFDATAP